MCANDNKVGEAGDAEVEEAARLFWVEGKWPPRCGEKAVSTKTQHDLVAALKELLRVARAAQPYVHTNCHLDEWQNRVNNDLITACMGAEAALAGAEPKD